MNLTFEIGTEELPAGEIDGALVALHKHLTDACTAARLAIGSVTLCATPRRLGLQIVDIAAAGETLHEEVLGPAARAAFDAEGKPTRAAEGFARGQGVDASALYRVETAKGEYVAAKVTRQGRIAQDVLTDALQSAFAAIPWKKSMRWGWSDVAFSRPVHWIVALLDDTVLPVTFGEIQSGRTTYGHRFLAPAAIELSHADAYQVALREAKVIASVQERRDAIRAGVSTLANDANLVAVIDDELVDEVANLVEWPVPLLGRFDDALLEVPKEVIILSMKTHQRYFALTNADGTLHNAFAFISNMVVPDPAVVIQGNLRVLRARLEDARFFWNQDRQRTLESRVGDLQRVVHIQGLGSVADRANRIAALAPQLAEATLAPGTVAATDVAQAAALCKADLVSAMVYEFPELQGTMGGYYARHDGLSDVVATAIAEHYAPKGAHDEVPATPAGLLVALADRLDQVAGTLGMNLRPTGNSDPYATRRAVLGIVRIVTSDAWNTATGGARFDLVHWLGVAVAGLPATVPNTNTHDEAVEFAKARVKVWLQGQGIATDIADAVVEVSVRDLASSHARATALQALRSQPDFEPLAAGFKRVLNILRKAADEGGLNLEASPNVDPALLTDTDEISLHNAVTMATMPVQDALKAANYEAAARSLIGLKPAIDAFFNTVLVHAPDPGVRANRLQLLLTLRGLFLQLADLSRIQGGAA